MTTLSYKEIGGYFGLDSVPKYDNVKDSIALNSARNCLRYVIRTFSISEIYIPFYTCPVVWQAIKKENCKIHFYHIDENFMPVSDFSENAYILYNNYFGICAGNVKSLASKYKNLIVDNAQAFYMPQYGIASFNSIRKFFGVPDGALLQSDKICDCEFERDNSYQRFSHLLKRADVSAKFGYQDFLINENSLDDCEIKTMSNLTQKLFQTIDIEAAKEKRLENFVYLSKYLSKSNELNIFLDKDDVPMVYPYLTMRENLRAELIKNKIFVATYWNPQPENTQEGVFQKYLLPLPIDQRYDSKDLSRILEVIGA